MELSNDWQKRTNVRLLDILSDILKEPRPPKVPKPTHGYTIAEKAPEIVTAPGAYFPTKKGEVIPLKPRQGGGTVTPTPTRTLREMVEKLSSYSPSPTLGDAGQLKTAMETSEPKQPPLATGQGGGTVAPSVLTKPSPPLSSFGPQPTVPPQDFGLKPTGGEKFSPKFNEEVAPNPIPKEQVDTSNWPLRQDGTKKGFGWLGVLPMKNGQVASEATIGVSFDGKEVLIPSMVPTLLPNEINYILNQEKLSPEMWKTPIGKSIVQKAVEHAKKRMGQGLSPFAPEGEQTSTTTHGEVGSTVPLISRQNGGEVDPNLFKNTLSVNSGDPTQQGIKAAANTASLNYTPLSPAPSLQSFAPQGEADLTPIGPSTPLGPPAPLTGMAEYEANARKIRGLPPETGTPMVNPTDNRLGQVTGSLGSFTPPAFKENTRSPVFGSDQLAARSKKYGIAQEPDLYERLKASSGFPGTTPLLSRQGGGPTSPNPDEGLTEEERKKRFALLKTEFPVESLAPGHESAVISPDAMREIRSSNSSEVPIPGDEFNKKLPLDPQGNLSEIKKEVLPSGETRYTLPGTEGTATVGPERFFLRGKEVPAGTVGAVSGDELARKRILREAAPPTLRLPETTYYDAHPEERVMDLARAENKPLLDAYQKLIEENRTRAQGFGLPMNPKVGTLVRAEATKAVPELTQGLEKMMAVNQTTPEKYYSADAKIAEAERRGVAAAEARAAEARTAEKNPTELGLIAKAQEIGPDGKPTQEAIAAQKVLEAEKKRKIDIQGGGIPVLTAMPPLPPGQKYNEAALEGVDAGVKETIKKIVTYDIPLPSAFALSKPYWQNIIARASAYDPTFSALQYPVKFGVRKSFTSGKDKDNIVALNTAVGHINSLVKAKDELANSNWQMGNQAANILAKYFPVSKGLVARQGTVTGVKTKFNAVKGEMANIFKRSGATDQEIKSWNDTVTDPSTATPASWKAFINGSLELMGSRIEALRSIYEHGIGAPKDFTFLSDKSRTILKNLGVDVNAIDPVAGSTGGAASTENKPRAADFGGNPEGGGAPAVVGAKTADDLFKKYGVQ